MSAESDYNRQLNVYEAAARAMKEGREKRLLQGEIYKARVYQKIAPFQQRIQSLVRQYQYRQHRNEPVFEVEGGIKGTREELEEKGYTVYRTPLGKWEVMKTTDYIYKNAYERALNTAYEEFKTKGVGVGEAAWLLWKDPWTSLTTRFGTTSEEDKRKYFEQTIFPHRTTVFHTMPMEGDYVGASLYFLDNPFTYRAAFAGAQHGLGYIKGIGKGGQYAAKAISGGTTIYTTGETFKGLQKSFSEGTLPEYVVNIGTQAVLTMPFSLKRLYKGQIYGERKRLLSLAKTPMEKAKLRTQFKTMDYMSSLSSRGRKPFNIRSVENLKTQPTQTQYLESFLQTRQGKKLVLGGSASQSTYIDTGRAPYDVDIYYKKPLFRSALKYETKLLSQMKTYGIDTSLFDVHQLPKYKSPFPQKGTGYTLKPIRTKKGSVFKWQTTFSEQAGRKAASTISPLHEFRGKDWVDTLDILKQKNPSLYNEMLQYQPTLSSKLQLSIPKKLTPSFPQSKFTFSERIIRRFGKGVESEFFTKEAAKYIKPSGEPFRPRLIQKQQLTPSWAKPTVFFSSSIAAFGGLSNTPLVVTPLTFGSYPKKFAPPKQYPIISTPIQHTYTSSKKNITPTYSKPKVYPKTEPIIYPKTYPKSETYTPFVPKLPKRTINQEEKKPTKSFSEPQTKEDEEKRKRKKSSRFKSYRQREFKLFKPKLLGE